MTILTFKTFTMAHKPMWKQSKNCYKGLYTAFEYLKYSNLTLRRDKKYDTFFRYFKDYY